MRLYVPLHAAGVVEVSVVLWVNVGCACTISSCLLLRCGDCDGCPVFVMEVRCFPCLVHHSSCYYLWGALWCFVSGGATAGSSIPAAPAAAKPSAAASKAGGGPSPILMADHASGPPPPALAAESPQNRRRSRSMHVSGKPAEVRAGVWGRLPSPSHNSPCLVALSLFSLPFDPVNPNFSVAV